MKVITFFNNKGGVGKTTITYNVGYKLSELGYKVLLVDLDPQCNLTSYALREDEIDQLWNEKQSIYYIVEPLIVASGDINLKIKPIKIAENLFIVPGDINLSIFEDTLSTAWTEVLARRERGFRITFGIYRYLKFFEKELDIDFVLIDLGPNFGPLNRMAILSCSNYVIPLIPDLFSLRGLMNIGKVIGGWSEDIFLSSKQVKDKNFQDLIPYNLPKFSGYVISQFNIYRREPTEFFKKWLNKIPFYIENYVVNTLKKIEERLNLPSKLTIEESKQIGEFRNLHSLVPKSQDASKPIYMLGQKDGVRGSHISTAKETGVAIEKICKEIEEF